MSKWLQLMIMMLIISFAKAHHYVRLIILAALGLAGLWMLHTLAQDFNKIYHHIQENHPAAASIAKAFLEKRSINSSEYYVHDQPENLEQPPQIDWERILTRDPVGCARSFVCQLVAANQKELPREESNILLLIRLSSQRENWASKQLQNAMNYGQQVSNPAQCRNKYKFCPYSSKMMMTILKFFGRT